LISGYAMDGEDYFVTSERSHRTTVMAGEAGNPCGISSAESPSRMSPDGFESYRIAPEWVLAAGDRGREHWGGGAFSPRLRATDPGTQQHGSPDCSFYQCNCGFFSDVVSSRYL